MSRPAGGRAVVCALAVALLLGACGEEEATQRQPEAPDDGIQITGTLRGQRLSVSDGAPEVLLGDCDSRDGVDRDLCVVARTLIGDRVAVVLENPGILRAGARLPVAGDDCTHCDEVTGHVVVEVRREGRAVRAVGGRVVVRQAGPRYAAGLTLRFADGGVVSGGFNVRPTPVPGGA